MWYVLTFLSGALAGFLLAAICHVNACASCRERLEAMLNDIREGRIHAD